MREEEGPEGDRGEKEREKKREREREREREKRKHLSVASLACTDQGLNQQPRYVP